MLRNTTNYLRQPAAEGHQQLRFQLHKSYSVVNGLNINFYLAYQRSGNLTFKIIIVRPNERDRHFGSHF
jgi:hypothetical protein